MKKQGIGLSLNGKELRVAHLALEGSHVQVLSLESAQMPAYVDAATADESDLAASPDINNPELLDANGDSLSSDDSENSADIAAQLVHSMINKYAAKKIKVGLNVPTTDVSYHETTDIEDGVSEKKTWFNGFRFGKSSFEAPKKEFIVPRSDRSNLKVVLESSTPFLLSLLERQNMFFKGHLVFSLMLPNELALVSMCRRCKVVAHDGAITIIIQVEDDFSHLIFLRGDELLGVTPFFTEFEGEGLYNILYSKILYELDHWQIDDIDKLFLASNAAAEEALVFFQERLPGTLVDYISPENNCGISSPYSREELSQYALSIALAWQALAPFDKNCSWSNMLPQRILDSQKPLRLSPAGILLLCILGAATLASTWVVMKRQYTNNKLKNENAYFEMQLKANEPIIEKVQMLTDKISQLAQVTTLADSLIEAYDNVLTFLNRANQSVEASNDVWVNQINNTESGFKIIGQSRKQELIPVFSSVLGKSVLRHVYQEYDGEHVFTFEIDLNWPSQPVLLPMPHDNPELQFAQQLQFNKEPTRDSLASALSVGRSHVLKEIPDMMPDVSEATYYPSPTDGHGLFTIALEQIPDLETGREFVQQIQQAGYDVFIRRRNDHYFISTETFSNLQDAEKKMLRLREKNITSAEIIKIDDVDTVAIDMPFADNVADSGMDSVNEQRDMTHIKPSEAGFASDVNSAPTPTGGKMYSDSLPDSLQPDETAPQAKLSDAAFDFQTDAAPTATVDEIQSDFPLGPAAPDEPASQTILSAAELAFKADAEAAPTVDDIQGDSLLGPPVPQELFAAAKSLVQPDAASWTATQNSDSSAEKAASVDSQFELNRDDYFFSDNLDSSLETAQSILEAENDSRSDGDSGDVSIFKSKPVNAEESLQSAHSEGLDLGDDAVIPLHLTAKKEKIFVLASDHYFSDSALEETQQLKNNNIEATILDLRIQGKVKPFWVCLGEFDNKADAETVINLARKRVDLNYRVRILDAGNFMQYRKSGAPM